MHVFVLNRHFQHFTPERAISWDLCLKDVIDHSQFTFKVFGPALKTKPFLGADYQDIHVPAAFQDRKNFPKWGQAALAAIKEQLAEISGPVVFMVQEDIRAAGVLKKAFPQIPLCLMKHDRIGPPRNAWRRFYKHQQMRKLDRIIFVSKAMVDDFHTSWPSAPTKAALAHNGLDLARWRPKAKKENLILYAGRLSPHKGVLHAAEGLAQVLPQNPDWKGVFLVSHDSVDRTHEMKVREVLKPVENHIIWHEHVPHAEVMQWFDRSAVALVPTVIAEPFGRVALEAHAMECALISSGTGGLREVSGPYAHYLESVNGSTIAQAVQALINAPEQRLRLQQEGRVYVEQHFDMPQVTRQLEDIFRGCLAE